MRKNSAVKSQYANLSGIENNNNSSSTDLHSSHNNDEAGSRSGSIESTTKAAVNKGRLTQRLGRGHRPNLALKKL